MLCAGPKQHIARKVSLGTCTETTRNGQMTQGVLSVQDIIFLVTTPLSIIGGLSILIAFLRHPQQLLFEGAVYVSFIFFQVLSTFLLSLKMLTTTIFMIVVNNITETNSTLTESVCSVLGVADQFSYSATVCWDFMITVQILWLLKKVGGATVGGFDFEENRRYWNIFAHTIVWTLCISSAIVPAILGQYGSSLNGNLHFFGLSLTAGRVLHF